MFKLVALSALFAVCAAAPTSLLAYSAPGLAYSAPSLAYSAPALAYSAPAVAYSAPALAYSAPVVASIPTSVSSQSSTVLHGGHAAYVAPVTTYGAHGYYAY